MRYSRPKRKYVWIILLFLSLVLFNLSPVRSLPPVRFARKAILTIVYPFQYVLTKAGSWTVGTFKAIVRLRRVSKENVSLRSALAELEAKEKIYESLKEENKKLRGSLKFKKESAYSSRMIGADIIGRSPSSWFEVIEVNRGLRDGVYEDMAVINKDGVVGRTVEVGPATSKVLLITDPGSSIGGQSKKSKDLGIVVGGAMDRMRMNYVIPAANIAVDDIIVTSGIGRVFPKGIPIGRVAKVQMRDYDIFKQVEIEPMVRFSQLEHVFLIR